MSRRKSRLGDESRAYKVPPSGAKVFKPAPGDRRPQVQIPLSHDESTTHGILARWPSSMGGSVQYGSPKREIIYTADLKRSSRPLPDDPYEAAERLAAQRKGAA